MAELKAHRANRVDVHTGGMRAVARPYQAHDTRLEDRSDGWLDHVGSEIDNGCPACVMFFAKE